MTAKSVFQPVATLPAPAKLESVLSSMQKNGSEKAFENVTLASVTQSAGACLTDSHRLSLTVIESLKPYFLQPQFR